jgi:hypothetical protein
MRRLLFAATAAVLGLAPMRGAEPDITYTPKPGPGQARHVVLLAGDEEYRSEEALPMLAKILSQRHGFKCTVLFSVDPDGTINPKNSKSLSNPAALDTADAVIMSLRFRAWPDEDMARFDRLLRSGKPIVALRTSTHAFNGFPKGSAWESWNYNNQGGFGKRVLGETWVTHWGRHKVEATRGVIEPTEKGNPLLRGVGDLFGDTDVYEAYPPADATILVRGLVLQDLTPDSAPATYTKRRATDKQEQGINDPAMPIVWTRLHKNEGGTTNRILTTTMGSATDLEDEDLRRLVVNGVYWGLGLDVPARADVAYVDEYMPSFYGFEGFRKGLRASDFELGKKVPGEPLPRPAPRSGKDAAPAQPTGLTYRFKADGLVGTVWVAGGNARRELEGGPSGGAGRVEIWKDGGKLVHILNTTDRTYYEDRAFRTRTGVNAVTLDTLTVRRPFKVEAVTNVQTNFKLSARLEQQAGFQCQRGVLTFSYDLTLAMQSVAAPMPAQVEGSEVFCLVDNATAQPLPFWHALELTSGHAEVDKVIAERLASLKGIPVMRLLRVTRRIEGGEAVSATSALMLSDVRETAVAPDRFEIPAGYRFQEPVIVAPSRRQP